MPLIQKVTLVPHSPAATRVVFGLQTAWYALILYVIVHFIHKFW